MTIGQHGGKRSMYASPEVKAGRGCECARPAPHLDTSDGVPEVRCLKCGRPANAAVGATRPFRDPDQHGMPA